MIQLLAKVLSDFIKVGRLELIDAENRAHVFGSSFDAETPSVSVVLKDRSLYWKLALDPDYHLGEAYMNGTLVLEEGTIWDLLDLLGRNLALDSRRRRSLGRKFGEFVKYLMQFNTASTAQQNVAHHYDLSRELYEAFLDTDLQYSCAYFRSDDDTLEQAQEAKKRHLAAKLLLSRNQRILDIGCGWGGLALYIARNYGARVDGITLSHEQITVAKDRAVAEGLDDSVRFDLTDYRSTKGPFDRIVSVGMFEHVGTPHYREFFQVIRDALAHDGLALIHSIGTPMEPGLGNPWIRKYIFPGGYIPALSEVFPAIEASGLFVTDVEILRLHYAKTLRHWRERFLANWDRVSHLYDERFKRMWEFYLAASEMSFVHGILVVFQIQLAKRLDAVPLTRDYIHDAEHIMARPINNETPERIHA